MKEWMSLFGNNVTRQWLITIGRCSVQNWLFSARMENGTKLSKKNDLYKLLVPDNVSDLAANKLNFDNDC